MGVIEEMDQSSVQQAIERAASAAPAWAATAPDERAACLDRAADLLEANLDELLVLCIREAGKTIPDAIAEVREAVDYCRYYASRVRQDFAAPSGCRGRRARATNCHCTVAACSRASARGTSRWRFSWAR